MGDESKEKSVLSYVFDLASTTLSIVENVLIINLLVKGCQNCSHEEETAWAHATGGDSSY